MAFLWPWGVVGLILLVAHGLAWQRAGRSFARLSAVWAVAWTAWWVEAIVRVTGLGGAPTHEPQPVDNPPELAQLGRVSIYDDWVRPFRPGAARVIVVGDSFTAGRGVKGGQALPDQLAAALRADGLDADVRNYGWFGMAFDGEATAYAMAVARHSPDVVVWVFVLNDVAAPAAMPEGAFITAGSTDDHPWCATCAALSREWTMRRQTALSEAGYRAAFGPQGAEFQRMGAPLRAIVQDVTSRGGRFVFAIYPLMHRLRDYPFAREHEAIRRVAVDAGAEVVDLLPTFAGLDERTLWATEEDHHPNAVAHELAGAALAAALRDRGLPRAAREDCALAPVPPGVDATLLRAMCAASSPAAQVVAARAMLDHGGVNRQWIGIYAMIAAWDAAHKAAPEPGTEAEARALVARAQSAP